MLGCFVCQFLWCRGRDFDVRDQYGHASEIRQVHEPPPGPKRKQKRHLDVRCSPKTKRGRPGENGWARGGLERGGVVGFRTHDGLDGLHEIRIFIFKLFPATNRNCRKPH